jgi:methenyltetrahydromethanopterin cyclohydrolase
LATLNEIAWNLCDRLEADGQHLRVAVSRSAVGCRLIDCGIATLGGLEAGRRLAEICLAGLGSVKIAPGDPDVYPGPAVIVRTDQPVAACMAAQYAGWQIAADGYFAMASGPMRAAAGREPLFEKIGHREQPSVAVGVLEATAFPSEPLQADIAARAGVAADRLTLVAAPTASMAGTLQIAARSVETALHKLHELGFDLAQVVSGWGSAPLPPVGRDQLTALGRTNDAILYGGEVTLWVRADDAELAAIGPRVPSGASADHGQPFATIFARYQHDFYRIDPLLFSPAVIRFVNLKSGRTCQFGHTLPRVLHESFEG